MPALLLNIAIGGYLAALVAGAATIVTRRDAPWRIAVALLAVAWTAHTASIVSQWVAAGHAPLSNLHESLVVFAWGVAPGALALSLGPSRRPLLPACALLALVALGYASLLEPSPAPLLPVLRSNWLLVHVSASLLAYAAFACAFAADVALLVRRNRDAADPLRSAGLRTIGVGFGLLTVGIATGAVWANQSWGSYWSWDPKETWSLVTWLLYGGVLHLRFVPRGTGPLASWASVAAFGCVLFTFFGVTYLLPSLHGYAT